MRPEEPLPNSPFLGKGSENRDEARRNRSGSSSGSGNKSSKSAVTSAATSDSSQPVVWGAMALIYLLGISMLLTSNPQKTRAAGSGTRIRIENPEQGV